MYIDSVGLAVQTLHALWWKHSVSSTLAPHGATMLMNLSTRPAIHASIYLLTLSLAEMIFVSKHPRHWWMDCKSSSFDVAHEAFRDHVHTYVCAYSMYIQIWDKEQLHSWLWRGIYILADPWSRPTVQDLPHYVQNTPNLVTLTLYHTQTPGHCHSCVHPEHVGDTLKSTSYSGSLMGHTASPIGIQCMLTHLENVVVTFVATSTIHQ